MLILFKPLLSEGNLEIHFSVAVLQL